MANKRPTHPDTNLKHVVFDTIEDLENWANGEFGTDYIISIIEKDNKLILFYIQE